MYLGLLVQTYSRLEMQYVVVCVGVVRSGCNVTGKDREQTADVRDNSEKGIRVLLRDVRRSKTVWMCLG